MPEQPHGAIARFYTRFAEEVHSLSPLYAEIGEAVAAHPPTLAYLAPFPAKKRHPTLLIAAYRVVCGIPDGGAAFIRELHRHLAPIRALMHRRDTQTNEPRRCAPILPVLACLPQPLALLDVGAAAGLCMLPDYYGYDYDGHDVPPAIRTRLAAPLFPCQVRGDTSVLPTDAPEIVWRKGLDLAPMDLSLAEDKEWLEALVWPGNEPRLRRLRIAMAVARKVQPEVHKGDMTQDLHDLLATAPAHATKVVTQSAVLMHFPSRHAIDAFAADMCASDLVWISCESPRVRPSQLAHAGMQDRKPPHASDFVMCVNDKPVAFTGAHGAHLSWLTPDPKATIAAAL